MAKVQEEAALIPPEGPLPSLPWRIGRWAIQGLRTAVDCQTDRWRLWAPVAFGGGCGLYFVLKTEPPLWPLALAVLFCAGLWGPLAISGSGAR